MPLPPPLSPPHLASIHAWPVPLAQDLGAAPSIVFWSAITIGLCVALFWVVSLVRKRIREEPASEGPATGFTLSDLRQLHKAGQMTDEEFERAKAKIVAAGKQKAAQVQKPLAGRRQPPPPPPSSPP